MGGANGDPTKCDGGVQTALVQAMESYNVGNPGKNVQDFKHDFLSLQGADPNSDNSQQAQDFNAAFDACGFSGNDHTSSAGLQSLGLGMHQINSAFSTMGSAISSLGSTAGSAISSLGSTAVSGVSSIASVAVSGTSSLVSGAVSGASSIASQGVSAVSSIASTGISAVSSVGSQAVSGVSSVASQAVSGVSSIASTGASAVSSVASVAVSGVSSVASTAVSGASSIVSTVGSGVSSLGSTIGSGVSSVVTQATSGASSVMTHIGNNVANNLDNVASHMSNIPGVGQPIANALDNVGGSVSGGMDRAGNGVSSVGTQVGSALSSVASNAGSNVSSNASGVMSGVSSVVSGTISTVSSNVSNGMSTMTSAVTSGTSVMTSAVTSGMNVAKSGVSSGMSVVSSFVHSNVSLVSSFVHSTVSVVSSGISSGMSIVTSGVHIADNVMSSTFSLVGSVGSNAVNTAYSAVTSFAYNTFVKPEEDAWKPVASDLSQFGGLVANTWNHATSGVSGVVPDFFNQLKSGNVQGAFDSVGSHMSNLGSALTSGDSQMTQWYNDHKQDLARAGEQLGIDAGMTLGGVALDVATGGAFSAAIIPAYAALRVGMDAGIQAARVGMDAGTTAARVGEAAGNTARQTATEGIGHATSAGSIGASAAVNGVTNFGMPTTPQNLTSNNIGINVGAQVGGGVLGALPMFRGAGQLARSAITTGIDGTRNAGEDTAHATGGAPAPAPAPAEARTPTPAPAPAPAEARTPTPAPTPAEENRTPTPAPTPAEENRTPTPAPAPTEDHVAPAPSQTRPPTPAPAPAPAEDHVAPAPSRNEPVTPAPSPAPVSAPSTHNINYVRPAPAPTPVPDHTPAPAPVSRDLNAAPPPQQQHQFDDNGVDVEQEPYQQDQYQLQHQQSGGVTNAPHEPSPVPHNPSPTGDQNSLYDMSFDDQHQSGVPVQQQGHQPGMQGQQQIDHSNDFDMDFFNSPARTNRDDFNYGDVTRKPGGGTGHTSTDSTTLDDLTARINALRDGPTGEPTLGNEGLNHGEENVNQGGYQGLGGNNTLDDLTSRINALKSPPPARAPLSGMNSDSSDLAGRFHDLMNEDQSPPRTMSLQSDNNVLNHETGTARDGVGGQEGKPNVLDTQAVPPSVDLKPNQNLFHRTFTGNENHPLSLNTRNNGPFSRPPADLRSDPNNFASPTLRQEPRPPTPINQTEQNVHDDFNNIGAKPRFALPNSTKQSGELFNDFTRGIYHGNTTPMEHVADVMDQYLSNPKVAHNFIADGCWARAHEIVNALRNMGNDNVHKVFVYGNLKAGNDAYDVGWRYHVAPLYMEPTADGHATPKIIDLSFDNQKPQSLSEWINRYADPGSRRRPTVQFTPGEQMYPPDAEAGPAGFGFGRPLDHARNTLQRYRQDFAQERPGMMPSLKPHNLSDDQLSEQFNQELGHMQQLPVAGMDKDQLKDAMRVHEARQTEMQNLMMEAAKRNLPQAHDMQMQLATSANDWEDAWGEAYKNRGVRTAQPAPARDQASAPVMPSEQGGASAPPMPNEQGGASAPPKPGPQQQQQQQLQDLGQVDVDQQ